MGAISPILAATIGLCAVLFCFAHHISAEPTPIVLWHGMGDTCCFPFSLGSFSHMLRQKIAGDVYVKSLRIGGSLVSDYESGFFVHPDRQVEQVCAQLLADQRLSDGFHAIGFSQGGQFLRAVAQRCPQVPMRTLISLGGQHQGVFGLPNCPSLGHRSCERLRRILNRAAYTPAMQAHLVQATYWHDPINEEDYRNGSTFLADINNERQPNADYVKNLQRLHRFVLVKFANDTIVQPRETQWFGFYAPGQDRDIVPLRESALYQDDRLGLADMDARSQLVFLESPGNHLQFTQNWFDEHLLPYLTDAN